MADLVLCKPFPQQRDWRDFALRDGGGLMRHVPLRDDEVHALALTDPYADDRWPTDALPALRERMAACLAEVEREGRAALCQELKRVAVEPWMAPLLAERLAQDPRWRAARDVVALIDEALREGHMLYFSGD